MKHIYNVFMIFFMIFGIVLAQKAWSHNIFYHDTITVFIKLIYIEVALDRSHLYK
jgi:hypothetical protein